MSYRERYPPQQNDDAQLEEEYEEEPLQLPQFARENLKGCWERAVNAYFDDNDVSGDERDEIIFTANNFFPKVIDTNIVFKSAPHQTKEYQDLLQHVRNLEAQIRLSSQQVLEARMAVPRLVSTKTNEELSWLNSPAVSKKFKAEVALPAPFEVSKDQLKHFRSNLLMTSRTAVETKESLQQLITDCEKIQQVVKNMKKPSEG